MQQLLVFPFLYFLFISPLQGQIKNIGLPFINNYSKNLYQAGSQTWDMVQDRHGLLYFANNDGILEFDGNNWQTYRINNQSVVRSVCIGNDNNIYAGAYNELGFLEKSPSGKLRYKSLVSLIPEEYRNFDEIWKIYQTPFGLVFQSFNYIFIYHNGKFNIIKPFSRFGFSFYCNKRFFIIDKERGILELFDGKLVSVISNSTIFNDDEVRFILPHGRGLLIGLLNHGLYRLEDGKLTEWDTQITRYIIKSHLFSGIVTGNDHFVFGSIRDGLYITDHNGFILQHINRRRGLQNNTILDLFTDKLGNIWSCLDNGISYVEISSPATLINHCFGIETGYVSLVYNHILYLGTNQGLFARDLNQMQNDPDLLDNFTLIEGTQGQVWSLFDAGNTLLCGHNNGTFSINGYSAKKISSVRGVWKFINRFGNPNELIAGSYTGLFVLRKNKQTQQWDYSHTISGFTESCKDIIEENDKCLWISHGYKGIFRIKLHGMKDSVDEVRLFTSADGLPKELPYEIHKINNQLFVTSNNGCFQFDDGTGRFIKSEKFNLFFKNNLVLFKLFIDSLSNIWFTGNHQLGVYRLLEDGNYREVTIPFNKFSNNLVPSFEHVYVYNEHNVFIGVQDGFIHFDPGIVKKYNESYPVYIREVRFLKKYNDSIITYQGSRYSGYSNKQEEISIDYAANSLRFRFAAPYYEDPDKTEYRCRLHGYYNEWSPWESRTLREYTNLHEGTYTFEVQARNVYKVLSETDVFTFEIRPPFHRSSLAYGIYLFLILFLIVVNLVYFKRRIEHTRRKDKLIHERKLLSQQQQFREESLLAEKKIEKLKNERLVSEMKHKNKELANSTMYIIQKNKFLTALKFELIGWIGSTINQNSKSKLKQLMRKIDKDINNEKYFKVFDSYFDEVHQDFLKRLKMKYPELSPKELKLCAYIRMNISSKEISLLLNISIRGVEVSRYRLRKKMALDHEINLTEYILNL